MHNICYKHILITNVVIEMEGKNAYVLFFISDLMNWLDL